jgi:hypothetical protein
VVAAQRAEAVDRRVAVAAARLAAHVERAGRVRCRVRLEAGAVQRGVVVGVAVVMTRWFWCVGVVGGCCRVKGGVKSAGVLLLLRKMALYPFGNYTTTTKTSPTTTLT